MPETKPIPLGLVDEPETAMRYTMDDEAMAELCESIAANGLLQPIGVVFRKDRYEIAFGHRRYKAHQRLGRDSIMAQVYGEGELDVVAAMVAENTAREDVNAGEEALWLAELREKYKLDEEGLCRVTKKRPDYIADRFRLLRGDERVLQALLHNEVNFAVARELNKCADETMRRYFLAQAIAAGTNSRIVRGWIDNWKAQQAPAGDPGPQLAPPSDAPPAEGFHLACVICGGDKDPYNMDSVYIHRHHLREIEVALRRLAEGA